MKRSVVAVGLFTLALAAPAGPAVAAPFTDALSRCLVEHSTPQDNSELVVWIFSAIGLHPDVDQYVTLTPAERTAINGKAAKLMVRLMTVDCRKETVAALKYEGTGAIGAGFAVLGSAATTGLMSDPAVAAGMASFDSAIDAKALADVMKEAGLPSE